MSLWGMHGENPTYLHRMTSDEEMLSEKRKNTPQRVGLQLIYEVTSSLSLNFVWERLLIMV